MKPHPFPLALHIGTDIVHLPRITRLLARRDYLSRFTRRILSDQEQQDFNARFQHSFPSPPSLSAQKSPAPMAVTKDMTRWLAGRFAAKEAARKAAPFGAASIGWKDVIVHVQDVGEASPTNPETAEGVSRRPEIVYLGDGDERGRVGRLSISHDGDYVVATVLATG
ncbi:hypothetical protein N7492_009584 [Penicillium capsulatum]|uniref:4'-phosphopantetheinyl transferase domain-containing protein n=1 Tax=Penicillium capsulatum TaxID=69766 RepID=A0A9W9HSR5_9EURO|nr:hypothetical protein N7492_009584 [Penicillium capsulatum]KAJ6106972.1 hypothetical protein N7512_010489 [Penicillium capsulatum]